MSNVETNLDIEAAEALRQARELMNDSGKHWYQGDWYEILDDGTTAYCAVGALRQVTGSTNNPVLWRALEFLGTDEEIRVYNREVHGYDNVAEGYPKIAEQDAVINYNDEPERTWEEISSAFERAEKKLRADV